MYGGEKNSEKRQDASFLKTNISLNMRTSAASIAAWKVKLEIMTDRPTTRTDGLIEKFHFQKDESYPLSSTLNPHQKLQWYNITHSGGGEGGV